MPTRCLALAATLTLASSLAAAQTFPSKPITLIVSYSAYHVGNPSMFAKPTTAEAGLPGFELEAWVVTAD